MKTRRLTLALAFGIITAHANAAPKWVNVPDTDGLMKTDVNSIEVSGKTVAVWVKLMPLDDDEIQHPELAYSLMHIRATCGATTLIHDKYIAYRKDGTISEQSDSVQEESIDPVGGWANTVNATCEKLKIHRSKHL